MRFMMMHKNDAATERGEPPPMELVTQMGDFIGEHASAGRFLDGAGLAGSASRTRLVFRGGRCTETTRGPYEGGHELPAATLLLKVTSLPDGLAWAERYGAILGDGELELGKINEPWDLGLMEEPPHAPLQLLLIEKADDATESSGRSAAQLEALAQLRGEMEDAGVLVRTYRLRPSGLGKRLAFADHELRIIDGPFAESKELLGGFSVMELSGLEEAIALCRDYARILGGTLEIDLREIEPA